MSNHKNAKYISNKGGQMSIERKCENCASEERCVKNVRDDWDEVCRVVKLFIPKEEVVRQDERKKITDLILNSNFYIKDNGKTYEVLVNELKPKMIDTFEESIRQDERKQALFDIAMELEKDIPILEGNYKYNNFGFQKGYWQGQLEYAYVLKNNLLDEANRKEL